jgi:16S rRNA (adenine1518-N6/adenine1519-N6)-dimethyltransferase
MATGTFNYNKSLGQNFIYDLAFLRSITDKLDILPTDRIVEIGTGAGTLTAVLAEYGAEVTTVEIDERLKPLLTKQFEKMPNVHLVWGDALEMSFDGAFRVAANVPYYITTPLIFQFLYDDNCRDISILVAKEVAERITARPATPEYGALSVACQIYGRCEIIKTVPKEVFTPQPKIDSAFVRIIKNGETPNVDKRFFSNMLKGLFSRRRKTILNGLLPMGRPKEEIIEILTACDISPAVRAETLPPSKFAELCQRMTKRDK